MTRPGIESRRLWVIVGFSLLMAACGDGDTTATTSTTSAAPASSVATAPSTSTLESPSTTRPSGQTTATEPPVDTTRAVEPLRGLEYEPLLTGLPFPIALIPVGDDEMLVALKGGEVIRTDSAGGTRTVLDISDRVRDEGERGFLGMALHPDDTDRFFAHYSDVAGDTTVSEFTIAPDGTIDPSSEQVLFTASQPAGNHNGGWIQFGPDGRLFLGLGDGGGADDQFGNGQNPDTPLAGLVRIDVDTGDAEKFATGLRNPWRFWIEGDLVYVADVGQNAYEEVSVASLDQGVNYGWSVMEGFHCFRSGSCDRTGLLEPVVEVEHGDAGTCSITGGLVSSAVDIPELAGHYLYSDYCGGWLRSFRFADGVATDQADWTASAGVPGQVVSFGYGPDGEIYVLTTSDVLEIVPVR